MGERGYHFVSIAYSTSSFSKKCNTVNPICITLYKLKEPENYVQQLNLILLLLLNRIECNYFLLCSGEFILQREYYFLFNRNVQYATTWIQYNLQYILHAILYCVIVKQTTTRIQPFLYCMVSFPTRNHFSIASWYRMLPPHHMFSGAFYNHILQYGILALH